MSSISIKEYFISQFSHQSAPYDYMGPQVLPEVVRVGFINVDQNLNKMGFLPTHTEVSSKRQMDLMQQMGSIAAQRIWLINGNIVIDIFADGLKGAHHELTVIGDRESLVRSTYGILRLFSTGLLPGDGIHPDMGLVEGHQTSTMAELHPQWGLTWCTPEPVTDCPWNALETARRRSFSARNLS